MEDIEVLINLFELKRGGSRRVKLSLELVAISRTGHMISSDTLSSMKDILDTVSTCLKSRIELLLMLEESSHKSKPSKQESTSTE